MACKLPEANGSASPIAATIDAPGLARCSSSRIASTGSAAMSVHKVGSSKRVKMPVPAARSTHRVPARSCSSFAIQATAAGGYDGRDDAYVDAAVPKPVAATSCTVMREGYVGSAR